MGEQRVMVRPGGRTEENRKAVAEAVLRLAARGDLAFDVRDIAELSGVHRTTIRRRWPDRDALLSEAMAEHTSRFTVDLSGDWTVVLRKIAFAVRDFMNDPVEDALNRVVAVSASDAFTALLQRHWQGIFTGLAAPLIAARKAGLIARDVDLEMALAMLSATILSYAVYARRPMDDARLERLVAQVVRGMRR